MKSDSHFISVETTRLSAATDTGLLPLSAFESVFAPFRGRKVGYIRMPGNVGDALLELAAFQMFARFGIEAVRLDPRSGPGDADEIAIAAGGNMGSFYHRALAIRLRVLAWGRPVTVLPQSFLSPEPLPYTRVYVRERESLRLCPDAQLAPDLALGWTGTVEQPPVQAQGIWLRSDAEGLFRGYPSRGDPVRGCRSPQEYFALASRFEHVVTDRLHFAIAALISGRRVTLLPNRYHKNRAMYDCWLQQLGCGWLDTPPTPVVNPGPMNRSE